MKRLIFLFAAISASSCSLIFEAANVSMRKSNAVAQGEVIVGDGFSVKVPESRLYSSTRNTHRDGVVLRPMDPGLDGLVYAIMTVDREASATPQKALDSFYQGARSREVNVDILSGKSIRFRKLNAYRATAEVVWRAGSQIAAHLVVERSKDYLILSVGHPRGFVGIDTLSKRKNYTDRMLKKLQDSITIHER